jgi:putative oxygen-independent coproporphyrinogen III oxidase
VTEHRPDSPVLADLAAGWKSAYVHIPFCRRRCPYCDFAIVDESSDGSAGYDQYVDALVAEVALESDFGPLDAINFGGGTPSRLSPGQLALVLGALEERFGFSDGVEVSLEVNPEDWSDEFGSGLVEVGFNRVSIGAQSFDPVVLSALGRAHDPDQIEAAVHSGRSVGIRSISLDLIFGHPSESADSWSHTIAQALRMGVDHISTYSLTVEAGTELSRSVDQGAPAPDDDVQADRYELFEELAGGHGFVRYEISNHAQQGHVCRYNLATWAHGEYVAFGLGAHDHRWGTRARNHRRLDRYLDAIEARTRPRIGIEHLTPVEQERDRFMVGLRLAAGAPLTSTASRFVRSGEGQRFVDAGILWVDSDRVRVLDPMMTDAVLRDALSVSAGDC